MHAKVTVRKHGGIFGPGGQQLMVAGRDRTKLATGMQWQVAAIRTALMTCSEFTEVPLIAALCFVDGALSRRKNLEIDEVKVRGVNGTAELVSTAGPLDLSTRERLARHLAVQFPAHYPTRQ